MQFVYIVECKFGYLNWLGVFPLEIDDVGSFLQVTMKIMPTLCEK